MLGKQSFIGPDFVFITLIGYSACTKVSSRDRFLSAIWRLTAWHLGSWFHIGVTLPASGLRRATYNPMDQWRFVRLVSGARKV